MNSIDALQVAINHLTSTGPIVNGSNAFDDAIITLEALRDLIAEGYHHATADEPCTVPDCVGCDAYPRHPGVKARCAPSAPLPAYPWPPSHPVQCRDRRRSLQCKQ